MKVKKCNQYRIFLDFVFKTWGPIPIFMLVFLQKFEDRLQFLNQGKLLMRVFSTLESQYNFLKVIEIEDEYVTRFQHEPNRYHFDNLTKDKFVDELRNYFRVMNIT